MDNSQVKFQQSITATPITQILLQGIEVIADYAIFILDTDGYIMSWNRGAELIKGYAAAEMIGQHFSVFYEQQAISAGHPARVLAAAKEQGHFEDEGWRLRKNGTRFWATALITAIYNNANELIGFVKITRDVTDRTQAQLAQLENKERRYQTLAQMIHSIIWTVDSKGSFIYPQSSWEAFTGQTWEQSKNYGWIEAVHPDDRPHLWDAWCKAIKTLNLYHYPTRLWCQKTNSYRHIIARAAPVMNAAGIVDEWIGTCLDITPLKITEQALQEVTDYLNLALDAAQVGLWDWHRASGVITIDDHVRKLFDLPSEYSFNNTDEFLRHIYEEDRPRVRAEIKAALAGSSYDTDYRVVWRDKSIHVITARGKIYRNPDTHEAIRFTGICLDTTQRKHAAEWLRKHQLESAQIAQISSMAEIASTLAHELNQPLTVISTYTQLCLHYLESGNYQQEQLLIAIKEAADQSYRAGEILHRMKDLIKKRRLHLEKFNIDQLIQESVNLIRYEIPSFFVDIQLNLTNAIKPFFMDKIQIQQAILNLLRNCIEAMRDAAISKPVITITSEISDKEFITITICDNGPGIPEVIGDKILEPYFTTKPYGMGLGLAICRTIIQTHGGQLIIKKVEKGACLQLVLPIQLEENHYYDAG